MLANDTFIQFIKHNLSDLRHELNQDKADGYWPQDTTLRDYIGVAYEEAMCAKQEEANYRNGTLDGATYSPVYLSW